MDEQGKLSSESLVTLVLVFVLFFFLLSFFVWNTFRYFAHVALIVACFVDSIEMLAQHLGAQHK